jgi:hypothetical protein
MKKQRGKCLGLFRNCIPASRRSVTKYVRKASHDNDQDLQLSTVVTYIDFFQFKFCAMYLVMITQPKAFVSLL